jgi:hypothetical protein
VDAGGREYGPRAGVEFAVIKDGKATLSAEGKFELVSRGDDATAKAGSNGDVSVSATFFGVNVEVGARLSEVKDFVSELSLGLTAVANDWFSVKHQDEFGEDAAGDGSDGYFKIGKGY